MTGYVVDASLVVKWLVDADLSDEAVGLLNSGSTFVAPALVCAEATNTLWVMRRRGDIAAAARLAADLEHPVYDCFYLALAVQTQYPVVTAAACFHDKVRGHPCPLDRIVHVARAAPRRTARRAEGRP